MSDDLAVDLDFHNRNTTYGTHGIHPYGAKFPPQLPNWAIQNFSRPGEWILDPFSGGGTTLVEGRLLGRNVAGGDIDPLSQRISLAKATPLDLQSLRGVLQELASELRKCTPLIKEQTEPLNIGDSPPAIVQANGFKITVPDFPRRDFWFHPAVSIEIALLGHLIKQVPDPAIQRFLEVVLSSCIISKTNNTVANVANLVHTRPHYRPKLSPPSSIRNKNLDSVTCKLITGYERLAQYSDRIPSTI